ncbi:PepSY domain-containing protein [Brachybacterium sp. YJGR34]|uniref:PepSY domain-containing protein n=1 Tax=Brachybacterium sp. YJGR34 TaxID=2059911 RepID=UPI000E0BDA3C|nr:PepSY domain-containing protein [Brachybacterium sp. YJGR34]
MTRTIARRRGPVRAAALGALVVALAAGCSGGAEEDPAATEAGGTTSSDGGAADGPAGDGAAGDDDATDDGAADDGAADDGATDDAAEGGGDASPLPGSADLATEELPVPAEEALRLATEAAGGGDPTSIQIDHDDDRGWVWEIEVTLDGREHEIDLDATTGEVLEHSEDEDRYVDPAIDVTDPLPYAEALDLAVAEQDGRVSGWDLDTDDGRPHYQVDIEQGDEDVEVDVDAETREVRVEQD